MKYSSIDVRIADCMHRLASIHWKSGKSTCGTCLRRVIPDTFLAAAVRVSGRSLTSGLGLCRCNDPCVRQAAEQVPTSATLFEDKPPQLWLGAKARFRANFMAQTHGMK
jgi:hypothetical protein